MNRSKDFPQMIEYILIAIDFIEFENNTQKMNVSKIFVICLLFQWI